MTSHEISIPSGEINLGGELNLPPQAPGLVLFAHGSGSSRHSPGNQYVARVLSEHDIGTLLFDLLTEEEEQAEAFTRHLRFNIPFLAGRLIGATHWIMDQINRDIAVGYFGASTGAPAARVAASGR